MNAIWFLSKERNLCIVGFNRVVKKNGETELWIKEITGDSRKLAVGDEAIKIEEALLGIVWKHSPAIITDGNGNFSTNINLGNIQEEEEEEEVE